MSSLFIMPNEEEQLQFVIEETTEHLSLDMKEETKSLNFEVDAQGGGGSSKITNIAKLEEFLYETSYHELNYSYAYDYFLRNNQVNVGLCTAVRSGNFYGRNFDWLYNNDVSFVVKTAANNDRLSTIGISGSVKGLTKEFVESEKYSDSYKILPFLIVDGINSKGLVCSTNVVPTERGTTSGTTAQIKEEYKLCNLMIPRFILDRFTSAEEAAAFLRDYCSIYNHSNLAEMGYDIHVMIADSTSTYCVEFIDNEVVIIDISSKPYISNFHIYGVEFNDDGSVYTPLTQDDTHNAYDTNHITLNGSGLERFNICNTYLSNVEMRELLDMLTYTNAYKRTTSPFWYTEFVGGERYTVKTAPQIFEEIVPTYIQYYECRERDGKTWQTVHSSIFNIEDKTLILRTQEGTIDYEFCFNYVSKDDIPDLKDIHFEIPNSEVLRLWNSVGGIN